MAKRVVGLVVGKDFRAPDGHQPVEWCYLTIDLTDQSRVSVRVSPDQVRKANVGDVVRLRRPKRANASVRRIERLGSNPGLLPPVE